MIKPKTQGKTIMSVKISVHTVCFGMYDCCRRRRRCCNDSVTLIGDMVVAFFVHTKIAANHAHTFPFSLKKNAKKPRTQFVIYACCLPACRKYVHKLFRWIWFLLWLDFPITGRFKNSHTQNNIHTDTHSHIRCARFQAHIINGDEMLHTHKKRKTLMISPFLFPSFNHHTLSSAIIEPNVNLINPIHGWWMNRCNFTRAYY